MTERIIDFLDALVATVGAIDERYCLVEKREMPYNGQTTNIPYKYVGNGNYRPVEVDGGSVSYWRLVNNISFDVVDGNSAIKNLQATYPIRYVAMVKRDENNPLVFSQDVANILEGRNHDLQTQLQAKKANIKVDSIDTDTPKIWGEEFTMPIKEPDYKRSLIMLDITVTVIAKRECWQDCDNYPDILQGFPWCEDTAATLARLTDEQLDCISDELCGAADPVTEQVNGVTIGTAASGTTNNQVIENTDGTPVGTSANPSVVADSRFGANGNYIIQSPAEVDATIDVHDTDGNDVGSDSGTTWEIADATVTINGSSLGTTGSVLAEGSVDIPVNLDGSPAGSWDGDSWEVTSAPCADATVNINGVFMDSIPSGGTENIEVRQETGATLVGSKQGQYWRIDDSAISINGSLIADVPSEESLDIHVQYENGTPVGTITGGVVEIPNPVTCASISVSVSDTTPDFGETITITATPTGISPTNYKFYYCTSDDLIEIADQAGNSYNWLVNQIGNITIVVIATDGSSSVTDMVDIVATTVFPLDLFSGATECNFLQLMTSSYTGALCTIRRSSDNALKDFYPDFITLTLNSDDGAGTTLGDWIGANSGYIYRVYSQVGGQDILITTVNEQPRIVNAGVLEVDTNGLASAYFDGSNNVYTLNSLSGEARVDAYIVLNSSSTFIVPFGTGSTYSFVGQNGSASTSLYSNAGTPLLYANNALQSPTTRGDVWTASGGSQKIITHEALNTSTWANFRIMNYVGAATQGKLAGIIAWTSDNSANRAAFTTALNAFLNSIY